MGNPSIIDTNVLVRFFLGDNKIQQQKASEWFKQATSGTRVIIVKSAVIAEVVYVLESFYHFSREQVMSVVLPFLSIPFLEVEEREILLSLWKDYLSGLHFIDAYLLACGRKANAELLTFDRKLSVRLK